MYLNSMKIQTINITDVTLVHGYCNKRKLNDKNWIIIICSYCYWKHYNIFYKLWLQKPKYEGIECTHVMKAWNQTAGERNLLICDMCQRDNNWVSVSVSWSHQNSLWWLGSGMLQLYGQPLSQILRFEKEFEVQFSCPWSHL